MVDATPPTLPNFSDNLLSDFQPHHIIARLTRAWYDFFTGIRQFLTAVRNGPRALKQADIAALTAKYKAAGTVSGVLIWVTDFQHMLRWNSVGWDWGPGEAGSGFYVDFHASATPGTGWHLADGATVAFLKADGSVGSAVLANTANRYFRI